METKNQEINMENNNIYYLGNNKSNNNSNINPIYKNNEIDKPIGDIEFNYQNPIFKIINFNDNTPLSFLYPSNFINKNNASTPFINNHYLSANNLINNNQSINDNYSGCFISRDNSLCSNEENKNNSMRVKKNNKIKESQSTNNNSKYLNTCNENKNNHQSKISGLTNATEDLNSNDENQQNNMYNDSSKNLSNNGEENILKCTNLNYIQTKNDNSSFNLNNNNQNFKEQFDNMNNFFKFLELMNRNNNNINKNNINKNNINNNFNYNNFSNLSSNNYNNFNNINQNLNMNNINNFRGNNIDYNNLNHLNNYSNQNSFKLYFLFKEKELILFTDPNKRFNLLILELKNKYNELIEYYIKGFSFKGHEIDISKSCNELGIKEESKIAILYSNTFNC